MSNPVPLPIGERMVRVRNTARYPGRKSDPQEGLITRPWVEWLTSQSTTLSNTPVRIHSAELQDQSAAVSATDVSEGTLAAGFYRVTYYATIVQAATTSSSLTVTLDWTDRSQSKSVAGTAITANAVTAAQVGGGLIRIDANSPVRYSAAYSSTGATPMKFDLVVVLERVEV